MARTPRIMNINLVTILTTCVSVVIAAVIVVSTSSLKRPQPRISPVSGGIAETQMADQHDFVSLQEGIPVSVAFSPDNTKVAVVTQNFLILFEAQSLKEIWKTPLPVQRDISISFNMYRVAFSPNSMIVAALIDDGSVFVVDGSSGSAVYTLIGDGQAGFATKLIFSRSGTQIAASTDDGLVKIWDVKTKMLRHVIRGPQAPIGDMLFSEDESTIVVAEGNAFSVTNRSTGAAVLRWRLSDEFLLNSADGPEDLVPIQLINNGDTLYGMSRSSIQLWNTTSSSLKIQNTLLRSAGNVTFAVASDNDTYAYPVFRSNVVHVGRISDPNFDMNFSGHTEVVHTIAFSSDTHKIASISFDGSLRIWVINS